MRRTDTETTGMNRQRDNGGITGPDMATDCKHEERSRDPRRDDRNPQDGNDTAEPGNGEWKGDSRESGAVFFLSRFLCF